MATALDPAPHAGWLPAAAARELAWWDAAALAQLSAELSDAACAWGTAWGVEVGALQVVAQPLQVPSVPGDAGTRLRCRGVTVGWATGESAARAALLQSLFSALPSTVDLATRVAAECHADALRRMAAVLGADTGQGVAAAADPALDLRPGSGALQVCIDGAAVAGLVLAGGATHAWRSRRSLALRSPLAAQPASLCEPSTALSGRPVTVRAALVGCELDLGTLQDLQVGDVLRLRHRLCDPATVSDAAGTLLFSGHLVQQRGAIALELATLQP
jgi:hypothetical protein